MCPGGKNPHFISCPFSIDKPGKRVQLNIDWDGSAWYEKTNDQAKYSHLTVEILDEKFRPVPRYSAHDCLPISDSGLRQPVRWIDRERLDKFNHPIRIRMNWGGVRPEDIRFYAAYIGEE